MKDYVSVVYNEDTRPKTGYPVELAHYLCSRYSIAKNSKFLDVGCGRGEFLEAFHKSGLEAYGVDNSSYASGHLPQFTIKECNLENNSLDFPDNTFDVVFSKSVIEHFFNPENFIKECRRVLKPGGRIVLLTPDWISQMRIFYDDYTHRTPFTTASLKDCLEMFGFNDIEAELFHQLPILWKLPFLKVISWGIQMFIPSKIALKSKCKFVRWSKEMMILATGIKQLEKAGDYQENE